MRYNAGSRESAPTKDLFMAKNAQQFEQRPWGTFEVIHEFTTTDGLGEIVIKKLVVFPQKRLSYQSHEKRTEHWHVIEGQGIVILDDQEIPVTKNSKLEIPIQSKHRIINPHPEENLVFIEITTGQFDENDIVRYEDDFGRS